jgi:hypothetical protein
VASGPIRCIYKRFSKLSPDGQLSCLRSNNIFSRLYKVRNCLQINHVRGRRSYPRTMNTSPIATSPTNCLVPLVLKIALRIIRSQQRIKLPDRNTSLSSRPTTYDNKWRRNLSRVTAFPCFPTVIYHVQ